MDHINTKNTLNVVTNYIFQGFQCTELRLRENNVPSVHREVLSEVMKGKSRKICYRADELMVVLQKCAGLNQQDGKEFKVYTCKYTR